MNESDRLIYLIYGLMFSEESRLEYEVYNSYEVLKRNPKDSYLIAKYLATVSYPCNSFVVIHFLHLKKNFIIYNTFVVDF